MTSLGTSEIYAKLSAFLLNLEESIESSNRLASLDYIEASLEPDIRSETAILIVDGSGKSHTVYRNYTTFSSVNHLSEKKLVDFSVRAAFESFTNAKYCIFINADVEWSTSINFIDAFKSIYDIYANASLGAFTVLNEEKNFKRKETYVQTEEEIPKTCFGMTRRFYEWMLSNGRSFDKSFSSRDFINIKTSISFMDKEDSPSPNFLA